MSEQLETKKSNNNIIFLVAALAALFFLPEMFKENEEEDDVVVTKCNLLANAKSYSASYFAFHDETTQPNPDNVDPDVCPRCLGEGYFGDGAHRQKCPDCDGTGKRTDTSQEQYSRTPSSVDSDDSNSNLPNPIPDNQQDNNKEIPDEFYSEAEDIEPTLAEAEELPNWREKPLKEMTEQEVQKLTPIELERKVTQNAIDSRVNNKTIKANNRFLLYFKADWCNYCKKQDPALEALIKKGWNVNKRYKYGGLSIHDKRIAYFHIIQLDADENADLVKQYGLTGLPAWVLINADNTKWKVATGLLTAAEVSEFYNTQEPPIR